MHPPILHRSNSGWQRFIKRGLHTLRHSQYQLLYVLLPPTGSGVVHKVVRASEVVRSAP